MPAFFTFGERREGYAVPVLNERAVRAAAGIVFLFAIVSFLNAWLVGNFQPTRVFVIAFLIDFTIRIFVNPRYAPTLILGQWVVHRQQPEWVGAPQKRFAWAIGFVLASTMLYLVVIEHLVGPINLFVCLSCLVLLFFESSFGICIGCKVYNAFHQEQAQLCPGGVCEYQPQPGAGGSLAHGAVLLAFLGVIGVVAQWVAGHDPYVHAPGVSAVAAATAAPPTAADAAEAERCKVPDFAKALGHEAMWKLHNNCK
ncbi:MAG: DUF4395 domain-containing protein [Burkholderiales bacterium]|nr:DUF4395 domain-containing protein [Burkholderiales bacterium]